MHLQVVLDEIICKAFPTTLKRATSNTISTFKELSGHFVMHFISGQRYKRSSMSLLNIKQWDNESLRSYVTHINKEALLIDEISFTEEDARRLHHPHDDALVINLSIADFNTWRVLVDNGSSIDIFYHPAFQQMRINKERLLLWDPLVRFGSTKVFPVGSITLPVTIGTYPQQITKEISFLVVKFSSTNNAINGQPTLKAWKAATSTYHLPSKIPNRV